MVDEWSPPFREIREALPCQPSPQTATFLAGSRHARRTLRGTRRRAGPHPSAAPKQKARYEAGYLFGWGTRIRT